MTLICDHLGDLAAQLGKVEDWLLFAECDTDEQAARIERGATAAGELGSMVQAAVATAPQLYDPAGNELGLRVSVSSEAVSEAHRAIMAAVGAVAQHEADRRPVEALRSLMLIGQCLAQDDTPDVRQLDAILRQAADGGDRWHLTRVREEEGWGDLTDRERTATRLDVEEYEAYGRYVAAVISDPLERFAATGRTPTPPQAERTDVDRAATRRELDSVWEWDNWPADTLVLIPCSDKKRGRKCAAEFLYTGSLFSAALGAARALNEDRYIRVMSAKHGFVALTAHTAPYNTTWGDKDAASTEKLAESARSLACAIDFSCVVSLMPHAYTERALQAFGDTAQRPFIDAMAGVRGIGDIRHRLYLISQLEDVTPRTPTPEAEWTDVDRAAARREGWDLFVTDTGEVQMCRLDAPESWRETGVTVERSWSDDVDVWRFVRTQTSDLHEKALRIVRETSPGEYLRMSRWVARSEPRTWLDRLDPEAVAGAVSAVGHFPDQADYLARAGGDVRYALWLRVTDEHLAALPGGETEAGRFVWRAAFDQGWSPGKAALGAWGGMPPDPDSWTADVGRSMGSVIM